MFTKFYIVTTTKGWNIKPNAAEVTGHLTLKQCITIQQFKSLIAEGYAFANSIRHRYDTFERGQVCFYDIDFSKIPMEEYVDGLFIKPTVCYTSPTAFDPSSGNHKFRLVYVLDSAVEDFVTYRAIMAYIQDKAGISDGLDCGCNTPAQFMNGNGTPTLRFGPDGDVVKLNEIDTSAIEVYVKEAQKRQSSRKTPDIADVSLDDDFVYDLRNDFVGFLLKYGHLQPPTTSSGDLHFSGLLYTHENGYYQIPRRWSTDPNGKRVLQKYQDGEHRRRRLFVAACIMLAITPELTLAAIVYGLASELYHYYDNTTDKITVDEIISIARDAMLSDWSPSATSKAFTVNHDAFDILMSYQQKVGICRRALTDAKIGEWYDFNLSARANYRIMKENGIKVSWKSVARFAREHSPQKVVPNTSKSGPRSPSINTINPLYKLIDGDHQHDNSLITLTDNDLTPQKVVPCNESGPHQNEKVVPNTSKSGPLQRAESLDAFIARWYDPTITPSANLKWARQHGVKVAKKSLLGFAHRHKCTMQQKKRKNQHIYKRSASFVAPLARVS